MLNGFNAYNPGACFPRYEVAYKEAAGVPEYSNTQLLHHPEGFSPNVFQPPDYGPQQPMHQHALQPGMQMQLGYQQPGFQSHGQQPPGLQHEGLPGMQAQDMQQRMLPQFISFQEMQPQAQGTMSQSVQRQGMQPQVLPQPGIQQGVMPQGTHHQGIQLQGMPQNMSHQAVSQQTILLQGMPVVSGNLNGSFGNFTGPQGGDDAFMGMMGPGGRVQAQRGPGPQGMGFQTAVAPQLPQQQALHGNRAVSGMASGLEMNTGQHLQSGRSVPTGGRTGPLQRSTSDNMQHKSQHGMMQQGVPQQRIAQQAPQNGDFFPQAQGKSDQRPGMSVLAQRPIGPGQAAVLPPPRKLNPQQMQMQPPPQQQPQRQGPLQQQLKQGPPQQQQPKQAPSQQQQKQALPLQQQPKQAPSQQQQKQVLPLQQQKQAPPLQQQKQTPSQQKQALPLQQQKQAPIPQQNDEALEQQKQAPQQQWQTPQQLKQATQQEQKVQVQKPSVAVTGTAGNSISKGAGAESVKKPPPPNATSSLYIDGLPPDVTQRELMHIFRPYAGYKGLRLVMKNNAPGHGMLGKAFIDFSDVASATVAMEALNGYKLDQDGKTPYVMRPVYAWPAKAPTTVLNPPPPGAGSHSKPPIDGNGAKRGCSEVGVTGPMSKRAKQISTGMSTYIEGGFGDGIQTGSRAPPPRLKVGVTSTGPGVMLMNNHSRGRDMGFMHGGRGPMFEHMGPGPVHPLRQGGLGPEFPELRFLGQEYEPGSGFGPGHGFAPGPGFGGRGMGSMAGRGPFLPIPGCGAMGGYGRVPGGGRGYGW